MSNIVVALGGVTLPTPDLPFTRPVTPNETDVVTFDGTLYTDFTSYRRTWQLHWGRLSAEAYEAIEAIFQAQYTTGSYPVLQIDYYDIFVPVKVQMNDKNIRKDGCDIVDVGITLLEKFSVS